jgi:hypothetical protein
LKLLLIHARCHFLPRRHRGRGDCTGNEEFLFCESKKEKFLPRNATKKQTIAYRVYLWMILLLKKFMFAALRGRNFSVEQIRMKVLPPLIIQGGCE